MSDRTALEKETDLYGPTFEYLKTRRRIREDSLLAIETPLHGRRIDCCTLTASGSLTAYEFKLSGSADVFLQASRNRWLFDRTFAVVAALPTDEWLSQFSELGIGVLHHATDGEVTMLLEARLQDPPEGVRDRVMNAIRKTAIRLSDVL